MTSAVALACDSRIFSLSYVQQFGTLVYFQSTIFHALKRKEIMNEFAISERWDLISVVSRVFSTQSTRYDIVRHPVLQINW